MIQNVIRSMGDISTYGVISVCLFFVVFGSTLIWACLLRKSLCEKMRALPLDDGSKESQGDFSNE
jgi:hypothetical protein